MTRVDAILIAIRAMLQDKQELIEDGELKKIQIEAKIENNGRVRVVLITPTFVRETWSVGLHGRSFTAE